MLFGYVFIYVYEGLIWACVLINMWLQAHDGSFSTCNVGLTPCIEQMKNYGHV